MMTPQEQQLLGDLTQKINQTVLQDKDPEAEQFLVSSLSRNPDAIYILAQTVLVQNYALTQAQQQIAELKQQPAPAAAPQKHTSFLGNLLGMQNESSAPPPMTNQTYPPTPQAQYAPVNAPVQSYPQSDYGLTANYGQPQYGQPYGQAQYGQPQYGQQQFGQQQPQQGSFLRSALQTAGGVAAGAMLFEGVESLMNGFEHHAGYSGRGFDGQGQSQPREEVVNNYYGDSAREEHGGHDGKRFGDNLPDTISPDIEDRRDDNNSRNFADTNASDDDDDSSPDDSSSYDDSGDDNSSSDDSN